MMLNLSASGFPSSQVADHDSHCHLYLGGLRQESFHTNFRGFIKEIGDLGMMAPGLENGKEVDSVCASLMPNSRLV